MGFVKFNGASCRADGEKKVYEPIAPIYINEDAVVAFYDHTIMTQNNKLRVMEDLEDIWRKLAHPPRRKL